MIQNRRILAVVPARGGSKGLPGKNIRPLLGLPLVAHVGGIISQVGYFDRAVVSTDDPEIAAVARSAGIDAPFFRPPELSGDLIGDYDVLRHALLEMEQRDAVEYDVIVMLQPTSPLRRPEHVDATIKKLVEGSWDAVWTVSPTDLKYHPLKQLKLDSNGKLELYLSDGANVIARQQLSPVYHRNGVAYAFSRDCLLKQKRTLGSNSACVVIDEHMISIDTLEDFALVERLLQARDNVSALHSPQSR